MPRTAAEDVHVLSSLLEAVLSACTDAVVEQDLEGLVHGWNPAAERLLGTTEEEARGQPFAQFVIADHTEAWRGLLADARAGSARTHSALILRRRDGLPVHVSLAVTPTRDSTGLVVGSCVVINDHTERRLAQETLALGEERVQRSEALAAVGSFVLDGTDHSVQWSEGMFRLFGANPSAFEGTRDAYLAMVQEEDRPAVAAALASPLRTGQPSELDHRAVIDGRTVWLFLAAEAVTDDGGRITGVRGVCQDITARKEAEASVLSALALAEKANEELRAVDALKDEFLATVSHELRTPLTSIIGFAQVLTKTAPELSRYVEPIARNGADMARMIEKLLDYSRLQAGHVALEPEFVLLAPEVERFFAVHIDASRRQVLRNEVAADLQIHTDVLALERVLGNLIGNASRYSGPACTIVVTAQREQDGSTLIAVADDGPGIPVEHQQHLFERFFQVPGAETRRGTGIGLAIVREYVAQQGGNVWCESSEGHGTTFFVRLPPPSRPMA